MKLVILMIHIIFLNGLLFAQSDNDKISIIRDVFYTTENTLEECVKNSFDFSGNSSQGGKLEIYSLNDNIYKAVIKYYGELGKKTKDFYYRNDSLFFVYEVIYNYNQPISLEDCYVESKEEYRYYIWNNYIVKFIDKDKKEYWNAEIPNFSEIIKLILSESGKIKLKFEE